MFFFLLFLFRLVMMLLMSQNTIRLHIAMNKPRGYVCSRDREGKDHKIIYDLLPVCIFLALPFICLSDFVNVTMDVVRSHF